MKFESPNLENEAVVNVRITGTVNGGKTLVANHIANYLHGLGFPVTLDEVPGEEMSGETFDVLRLGIKNPPHVKIEDHSGYTPDIISQLDCWEKRRANAKVGRALPLYGHYASSMNIAPSHITVKMMTDYKTTTGILVKERSTEIADVKTNNTVWLYATSDITPTVRKQLLNHHFDNKVFESYYFAVNLPDCQTMNICRLETDGTVTFVLQGNSINADALWQAHINHVGECK